MQGGGGGGSHPYLYAVGHVGVVARLFDAVGIAVTITDRYRDGFAIRQ